MTGRYHGIFFVIRRTVTKENGKGRGIFVSHILLSLAAKILMTRIEIIKLIDDSRRFFTLDGSSQGCEFDDADCVKRMEKRTEKFLA